MSEYWVPEDKRDTRWYLWNNRYMCRVSNLETMSTDYIKHFGMPTTGDSQIDSDMSNELVERMLTIVEMVNYHKQGVIVRLVQYERAKEIYERITDHLLVWKNHLETAFHVNNAPIDDLIALDAFAVSVYAHAKYQFTREITESILANRLATTLKVTRNSVLRPMATIVSSNSSEEKEEKKYPDRISMADIFAGRRELPNGARKWKNDN